MKAILQICQNYRQPFLDCTRQYAALFSGSDYKVVTVFLCGQKDPDIAEQSGADEVIFLEHHRDELEGLKLNMISEIKKIRKQFDFKLCIAHRTKPTYLALMGTDLPVFSIHHAFGDLDRLGRRLFTRLFRHRLTLFAVSNAVRDELQEKLPHWPAEKILTLHNRVDAEKLKQGLISREDARALLSIPETSYVVANVGRLHPDKDQSTLIRGFARALPQLPDSSRLLLIGEGKDRHKLQTLCDALNITSHVTFTGQVPNAKILFRAFDLFVLSSDHEPFGMVLLEAMVAGVPVICSDSGGGPEVVADIGELFTTGDDESLAHAIVSAFQNKDSSERRLIKTNERLALFSDEHARTRFWSLPVVNQVLADTEKHRNQSA